MPLCCRRDVSGDEVAKASAAESTERADHADYPDRLQCVAHGSCSGLVVGVAEDGGRVGPVDRRQVMEEGRPQAWPWLLWPE